MAERSAGAEPNSVSPPPKRGRARRALVVGFVAFHTTCVLITGLPKPARELVWPLVEWYTDGLKLTNRWGMFSKPPRRAAVVVVADRASGDTVELSSSIQGERSLVERIVDVRLRKIQGNLTREDERRHLGRDYLGYWCRLALQADPSVRSVRLVEKEPEKYDDDGQRELAASEKTLLGQPCGRGSSGTHAEGTAP